MRLYTPDDQNSVDRVSLIDVKQIPHKALEY